MKKREKLSLLKFKVLSRKELKQITAGSGGSGCPGSCVPPDVGPAYICCTACYDGWCL